MHSASVLTRRSVDLDTEIAYWRGVHAEGHLGGYAFADYARLLTLGYDIYLAYPRATEAQLYGLRATGLRFFTVYGPWGRPDMAPLIFSRAVLAPSG